MLATNNLKIMKDSGTHPLTAALSELTLTIEQGCRLMNMAAVTCYHYMYNRFLHRNFIKKVISAFEMHSLTST